MSVHRQNIVSLYRNRWRLSQKELGLLLGLRSISTVSRLETGERLPTKAELLALEIIFGASPKTLFSEYYQHMEEAVMRRAAAFYAKLDGRTSAGASMKRKLLDGMIARANIADSA